MTALALLLKYRNQIAVVLVVALLAAGVMWWRASLIEQGRAEVQAQWNAAKEAQRQALEATKAQAAADVKMALDTLQQLQAARDQSTSNALKGLANEIRGNRVYSDCRITDTGLRLYREAGTAGRGGGGGDSAGSMEALQGASGGNTGQQHGGGLIRGHPEQGRGIGLRGPAGSN